MKRACSGMHARPGACPSAPLHWELLLGTLHAARHSSCDHAPEQAPVGPQLAQQLWPNQPPRLSTTPRAPPPNTQHSYDLGLIGGAMLGISDTFAITSTVTKEAIVGAAKLGAFSGTYLGGALMLRYGRRIAIVANAGFFTLGPLIMAMAGGPGCARGTAACGGGGTCAAAALRGGKRRRPCMPWYSAAFTAAMQCTVGCPHALKPALGPPNPRPAPHKLIRGARLALSAVQCSGGGSCDCWAGHRQLRHFCASLSC